MYCIQNSGLNAIKSFFSFNISGLLCWFALFSKFSFPSDQLSLLLCFLSCLSQVHSGSKLICFFLGVCSNFVPSSLFFALNCALVACGTSIFYIVNVKSLLRLSLAKSSSYWEAVRFKIFFCADSHCSSSFLLPEINLLCSFEKYNTKNTTRIQHVYTTHWYNMYHTL